MGTGSPGAEMNDLQWWVFPLAPYRTKKTTRTEIVSPAPTLSAHSPSRSLALCVRLLSLLTSRSLQVPGQVWAVDQLLGALYVHVPIRCTVLKIKGGLFLFNTVAPTEECLQLVSTPPLPSPLSLRSSLFLPLASFLFPLASSLPSLFSFSPVLFVRLLSPLCFPLPCFLALVSLLHSQLSCLCSLPVSYTHLTLPTICSV
eukprot:470517-Rhodomonas_salina.1